MTIEEYLTNVTKIYYQVSVIIKGRQLLVDGTVYRSTDIHDNRGKLSSIRFSNLSLPAATKVDSVGTDYAAINFGDARMIIWPTLRRLVPKLAFHLNKDGTARCMWCEAKVQPTAEDNVIHWHCKNCGNDNIPEKHSL